MADITITIGEDWVSRVLDAFDGSYPGRVVDGEELYTKAQWAKMKAVAYVKDVVQSWEAKQASEAARDQSLGDTEGVEVS